MLAPRTADSDEALLNTDGGEKPGDDNAPALWSRDGKIDARGGRGSPAMGFLGDLANKDELDVVARVVDAPLLSARLSAKILFV